VAAHAACDTTSGHRHASIYPAGIRLVQFRQAGRTCGGAQGRIPCAGCQPVIVMTGRAALPVRPDLSWTGQPRQ
jgi:hypothetical protein